MFQSIKTRAALLLLGTALSCAACSPTISIRGNLLETHQLQELKPGVSTRSDVLKSLGSPTTQSTFDSNIWYYIGQETAKTGIFDPEVTKERIVMVAFNQEGVVQDVRDVDRAQMNIPIERDKTPTYGTDSGLLKQFFGNLGKFNPESNKKK